ncbi:MAG: cell wall hydrolase [Lachnospiraceae bacterium]|nr:cell wall hydrolase [Lachnospiraceae bacterium]
MKQLYKELTVMTTAAVLCVALASTTAMAGVRVTDAQTSAAAKAAAEALSPESVIANLEETVVQEKSQAAVEEKAAKDAWEKAEQLLEEAAEKEEKEAEEATKQKAEEAVSEKAVTDTAEQTMKEVTEAAAAEAAALKELGLSADARVKVTADELDLLAAIIYCEAGGEEITGKVAVGAVVLNRVLSTEFENTIAEVIYAPGQFTPAMTGLLDQVLAEGVNEECYAAARAALNGENPVEGCLYFNSGSGSGIQIGNQHFY